MVIPVIPWREPFRDLCRIVRSALGPVASLEKWGPTLFVSGDAYQMAFVSGGPQATCTAVATAMRDLPRKRVEQAQRDAERLACEDVRLSPDLIGLVTLPLFVVQDVHLGSWGLAIRHARTFDMITERTNWMLEETLDELTAGLRALSK